MSINLRSRVSYGDLFPELPTVDREVSSTRADTSLVIIPIDSPWRMAHFGSPYGIGPLIQVARVSPEQYLAATLCALKRTFGPRISITDVWPVMLARTVKHEQLV